MDAQGLARRGIVSASRSLCVFFHNLKAAAVHSQYRLCPAHKELDEECFQATPVPFASNASKLRWGGTAGDAKACEVRTPRNSRPGLLLAVG